MHSYTVVCLSEALSPITHMSGTAGNEAIVAREPVVTKRGTVWLPFLSGNALRHRCVREPGVMWLIREYGLAGKLTLPQLNFLLHGGNLSESNAHENTRRIADMQRLWPLLRLCGGSLPNQILAGSMDAWRGALVCEENRRYLEQAAPGMLPESRLQSAERCIGNYQYTRQDAAKRGMVETDEEHDSNLMIFSGQAVSRGSLFLHGFLLRHVATVELGALLLSLQLWQEQGGTIGGQSARGHGRLSTSIVLPDGMNQDELVAEYVDHARTSQEDAVAWLYDCFAARPEKPKKAKVRA